MSDDAGFLARWARRKSAVRDGRVVADSKPDAPLAPAAPATGAEVAPPPTLPEVPEAPRSADAAAAPPADAPLPTLADVAQLTRESDFARFVAPGVDESVKRAALKKLFSDPHYNIMDGLDTYIDDYGKADPIPAAMLRRMTQSKFLRLFDDEEQAVATAVPRPDATPDGAPMPVLSQSPGGRPDGAGMEPETRDDEDPAVRLQPDDAAGPPGAAADRAGPRA